MSLTIDPPQGATPVYAPSDENGGNAGGTGGSTGSLPPTGTGVDKTNIFALFLPELAPSKMGGISLDVLVQALGAEERQAAVKSGLETLQTRAAERDEANAKKLEDIQKNLETMKEKDSLSGFLKAFKIIGMILGAIAAIATTALGAVTGNPLLIAAGVLLTVMAVNSIVSEASDGKYSIAAGITELAKQCGASEETAQWIGFATEMAITLVACALSLGAGVAGAGAKAAETAAKSAEIAEKVTQIVGMTSKVTSMANAANSVALGVTSGIDATYSYDIAMTQADQKELEAILERIATAIETETDFMETLMQRVSELMADVGEIVQSNAEMQTALLTNSAPNLA
ncbi:MAG: type III secretion system translocon subunit SctE [Desulfovibrio sp.]|nr:type III secretion system translocon subunit SctE [Desulfovibrio sp.]